MALESRPDTVGFRAWPASAICSPRPRPRSARSTPPRPTSGARRPGTVVLDVREPDEYEQGAIPGALHIPRGHLESQHRGPRPRPRHARSSSTAPAASARPSRPRRCGELGYTDVVSMAGGFNRWKDEGRDWRAPVTLTPDQRNRYQRHLLLPEVGVEGQLKLLDAKVLLLGAGGLGSPAALYLAAAGVGTHRHRRHGRGRRVEPAAPDPPQPRPHRRPQGRLGQEDADALNPDVNVVTYDVRLGGRQRDGDPRRLRRRRRRHRQLPEPLPAQRRLGEARHPGRARLDLPLRGHGHRVRPDAGPDLPRHGARAAAGRAGAVVRRGRRARRAARHHRLASRRSRPSS